MLKPNSPFSVKPRLSKSFMSWFWNFSRRCNDKDMMSAGVGRHALLQSSKRLYQQIIVDEQIDCEWQEVGLLFVFDHEKEFAAFAETDALLRKEFGVGAEAYDGKQLVELEPAIKEGFGGAWHYESDCHLRPDKFLSQMKEKLVLKGVEVIENFSVSQFLAQSEKSSAVESSSGIEIEADHFVVATGSETPSLNKQLGMNVPIQPGKGYSLTMPKPTRMPKIPIIFEDSHVAVTPMESKYRIGSTMEFAGYDTSINPKRLALLKKAAEKYLHEPHCDPIEETWFGWRPMTWDGKPVIDRSPAMKNVWIAAGHNMLGLSMATATGQLLKELMLGEEPHIDPSHFSASRFM
jgi:D-amino-acid dehydrogenase